MPLGRILSLAIPILNRNWPRGKSLASHSSLRVCWLEVAYVFFDAVPPLVGAWSKMSCWPWIRHLEQQRSSERRLVSRCWAVSVRLLGFQTVPSLGSDCSRSDGA